MLNCGSVFALVLFSTSSLSAETHDAPSKESAPSESDADVNAQDGDQQASSAQASLALRQEGKPLEQAPEAIAGFFFGRVLSVDPSRRFVYVRSVDEPPVRKMFYFDRQTQFREKKRRINFAAFEPGDQVAVRFFARGETAIADALFLVKGEFNMKDYRVVRQKKESEAGGAAAGHGAKPAAEKPAEKPAAGGH